MTDGTISVLRNACDAPHHRRHGAEAAGWGVVALPEAVLGWIASILRLGVHCGAGIFAMTMSLVLMVPPPALAQQPEVPGEAWTTAWCRQNSSLTMGDYIARVTHLAPLKFWGGSATANSLMNRWENNELFKEVPKDVLIIPDNTEYITLKEAAIGILPVRRAVVEKGMLPAHAHFTDVCKAVGPWGNMLLVINEKGYLRYIDAADAQTVALYDAEMRLQQKFRPKSTHPASEPARQ